ncbi:MULTISPECIES: DUF6504 family protein [unclassified Serinicoccus]|uniref:DUF6504 family protein n=1 Tax=unclassified Serinicoccus TaxID=2643101 RepID=UPI00385508CC
MSRRYHEQVEVRLGPAREHGVRVEGALSTTPGDDQVPTLFLWRGRLHLVRAVLAQWSQRVPWWRGAEDEEGTGGATEGSAPALPTLERVVWRVEAGAGRTGGTGVYDLAQGERWWLDRVTD